MSANLASNLKFQTIYRVAWLIAGLSFFSGCASVYQASPRVSAIDAHYQLASAKKQITSSAPASPSVRFYQDVIRTGLGSHCTYFPSDSEYAIMISRRCGPIKTTIRSFERFSREFDAAYLGLPILSTSEGLHFKDIPDDCS
ncbi:putative membrane protein insertion efficiency factor [compost metagenome]